MCFDDKERDDGDDGKRYAQQKENSLAEAGGEPLPLRGSGQGSAAHRAESGGGFRGKQQRRRYAPYESESSTSSHDFAFTHSLNY